MTLLSKRLTFFLFLLPILATCAPFVKDGPPVLPTTSIALQTGQNVGQTITARDGGFEGTEIFLTSESPGDGEILLRLRSGIQSSTDLAVASLAVRAINAPRYYRFTFSPQSNSKNRDYYLLVELRGNGGVRVGTAPGDAYHDGAFYRNGEPRDAQLAFRLVYEPWQLSLALLAQVWDWLGVLALTVFLFVLPGWTLLNVLSSHASVLTWAERLGLAIGLSLALYPLLMLWTNLVHVNLGTLYAWVPAGATLVVLIWRQRIWRPPSLGSTWQKWQHSTFWQDLALVVLFGLIFAVRFWVIRSLDLPMWGDSYQHTVIAQLMADNGGLFNSWEPYADIQSFTYHFGFHTAATVFHWISGLDMPKAVLWSGQILNGLAVLAMYPLATRVGGNPWAGVAAVLLGGLLSPMPMGYVNWGRYTQLAGQAILPAAICLSWAALEAKPRNWRTITLAWIALGGLAVTHYRILIFATIFFIAFFLLNATKAQVRVVVARTLAIAVGAAFLFLPWFLHIFAGKIMLIFSTQLSTPAAATLGWIQEYNAVGDVFSYVPAYLWLLLPPSIAWGLWRRVKGVAIFTLWWLLVFLAANPRWLQLPGEGVLTNFTVFIAAYIPAGVLLGAVVGWLVGGWRRAVALALLSVTIGVLGLWGARLRLSDIHIAQSALATKPDERAAAWIRQNTTPNATFLVNAFFAYGGSSVVGSDGGWWLPLLARRRTLLPPLNYASEQGPRPDYREWINALPFEIQTKGITNPEVVGLLHERGITHIYIGQRQGQVNAPNPAMLQVDQLLSSPDFRPIYHQDRVWVFEVAQ